MRALVQRVSQASVAVAGEIVGQIDHGLMVLLGVGHDDDERQAAWMAKKLIGLRVFDDANGKMNLALQEVGGAMLIVSQFTLFGDCKKGRRPSFVDAAPPELAERLYGTVVSTVRDQGVEVATGRFRQHMEVALVNNGPVTLWLESP